MTAIVGIDPSLRCTGVAVNILGRVSTARLTSKGHRDDPWTLRHWRINHIAEDLNLLIPFGARVYIEAPAYGATGGSMHDRSGLWWAIYGIASAKGCTITPITPSQRAKYATGKGAGVEASKDRVLAATIRRYPNITVDGNDVADAVILMAMGCRLEGDPIEESLPQSHIDALLKVKAAA